MKTQPLFWALMVGEGFEPCEWSNAEEYAYHLSCTPFRASDNWLPIPEGMRGPFYAQGHRFCYRKKIAKVPS